MKLFAEGCSVAVRRFFGDDADDFLVQAVEWLEMGLVWLVVAVDGDSI